MDIICPPRSGRGVNFNTQTLFSPAMMAEKIIIKGTRCLGSDELVYKKAFVTVCY